MILHCREFDIDGNSVILGHDRETGKRYLVKYIYNSTCIQHEFPELAKKSNFLQVFHSIFWIDEKKEGERCKE